MPQTLTNLRIMRAQLIYHTSCAPSKKVLISRLKQTKTGGNGATGHEKCKKSFVVILI